MHNVDFTLNIDEISKVEGSASVDVKVKDGKVEHVHYEISEYKRFYTKSMEGKPFAAIPQLLARICGTCSNAHIMCAIEACEKALGIKPTEQTMLLRKLTMYGLMIRDHALHLYLFAMPDMYDKDAFLEFDEDDPEQHQHLHDAFEIKAAGNHLAELVAGRSVHATYPTIGGFIKFPDKDGIREAIEKLEAIRPAVLRCIEAFDKMPFHLDRHTNYMALVPDDIFGFLEGTIIASNGEKIPEPKFREHLEHVVLPYSQASAYTHEGEAYMVGSLARINVAKDKLHPKTRETLAKLLEAFPSTDIFRNNVAQAIEILHSLDHAIEILQTYEFREEPVIKTEKKEGVGIGVVEAPRGTLYHKVEVGADGIVTKGEVIVPTGQNQINIEKDIHTLVQDLIDKDTPKDDIPFEIEKLVRAYDPCMSCAAHFLKVNWK